VLESGFALRLLRDLEGLGGVRQKLIAPLVVLRLADLVVLADGGHRLPLEAFEYDGRFGLGVPLPSFHG
jgi:hypothetical protein